MKTNELTGVALDWAVAKTGGGAKDLAVFLDGHARLGMYKYSTDWAQGGPIIEREGISLDQFADYPRWKSGNVYGPTPLIAAMRCYVASRLGDDVEIPIELEKEGATS